MKYLLSPIEFKSIKEMPTAERPREKLLEKGAFSLSDLELLCCILGKGVNNRPVQDIAHEILELTVLSKQTSCKEFTKIQGLGIAKAAIIAASLEFGRRFGIKDKRRFENPQGIYNLIRHYGDRNQEHFISIILNGALEVLSVDVVTVGLINKTLVHPREVFAPAIVQRATAIIVAHNHPSGCLKPSNEDLELTKSLVKAGNILGIRVLDHLIFSGEDYFSMAENGIAFQF